MAVNKEANKQVLVTLPLELLQQVEDYWHREKLANRSEAIRELVKKGLSK